MKNLYFLSALCGIFFISCSKHCDKAHTDQKLTGSWKWIKTDGGIGNNIHDTPASTGKEIELALTSAHTYSFYVNGVPVSSGTFTLSARNCIHDHTDKTMIDFSSENDIDIMVESIVGDILTVSDENYDGTVSLYSRQ